MSNRVDESMTRWQGASFVVRIWGKQSVLNSGPRLNYIDALESLPSEATLVEVAACLDGFQTISAYEILDFNGQGVCVYPDWP